jgi:predicted transcriptional regulator
LSRNESKRSKTQLYASVLEVLIGYPEGVKITRLSYGVGVPVDRLRDMVEDLCSFGLIKKLSDDEGTYYFTTPRGLEFLDTYWKMQGFLEIFGDKESSRKTGGRIQR